MALKNYKVSYQDGTETYYQFDEDDPGFKALKARAAQKDSDIKSIAQGSPEPINPK